MLNEEQQKLFSKVLDYNHEMLHGETGTQRMEALGKLTQAKTDLKNSMGEEAYNTFMTMGKRMFAPKSEPRRTTSDGDEFLEDED